MDRSRETCSGDQSDRPAPDCLERARAGVEDARNELVRFFTPALRQSILLRSGARLRRFTTPEDLVQEIFKQTFASIDRLRHGADAEDFMRLLFQHAGWIIMRQGRRAREFNTESEGPEAFTVPDAREVSQHSTGIVTRADDRRWLDDQVGKLSPIYAAVIRLYLEGKSFPEIAEALEVSESAVRQRFRRAALQLRTAEEAD